MLSRAAHGGLCRLGRRGGAKSHVSRCEPRHDIGSQSRLPTARSSFSNSPNIRLTLSATHSVTHGPSQATQRRVRRTHRRRSRLLVFQRPTRSLSGSMRHRRQPSGQSQPQRALPFVAVRCRAILCFALALLSATVAHASQHSQATGERHDALFMPARCAEGVQPVSVKAELLNSSGDLVGAQEPVHIVWFAACSGWTHAHTPASRPCICVPI